MEKLPREFVGTLDALLKKLQTEAGERSGFSRLTISQLGYIDAIHTLGNPTITGIAQRLLVTKASVTNSINKLIALGYVTKAQSDTDKRVFHVSLTEIASVLVKARSRALRAYGDFIGAALSKDETRQFTRILTKLVSKFKEGE
jgi:DNA-binding MarR family transcriptional regulator